MPHTPTAAPVTPRWMTHVVVECELLGLGDGCLREGNGGETRAKTGRKGRKHAVETQEETRMIQMCALCLPVPSALRSLCTTPRVDCFSLQNHLDVLFVEVDASFEVEQAVLEQERSHLLVRHARDQSARVDQGVTAQKGKYDATDTDRQTTVSAENAKRHETDRAPLHSSPLPSALALVLACCCAQTMAGCSWLQC